jgi:hypothetical protein
MLVREAQIVGSLAHRVPPWLKDVDANGQITWNDAKSWVQSLQVGDFLAGVCRQRLSLIQLAQLQTSTLPSTLRVMESAVRLLKWGIWLMIRT